MLSAVCRRVPTLSLRPGRMPLGHIDMFLQCQFFVEYRRFRDICKVSPVLLCIFIYLDAIDFNTSFMRVEQSQYVLDGRTLSRPVQTDQADDLPASDIKVDIMYNCGL